MIRLWTGVSSKPDEALQTKLSVWLTRISLLRVGKYSPKACTAGLHIRKTHMFRFFSHPHTDISSTRRPKDATCTEVSLKD